MKKHFILFVFFMSLSFGLTAQSSQAPILIQSASTVKITSTLDSAIALASAGDAIYLPSGTFTFNAPTDAQAVNKQLFIYGTGWREDSSAATGTTKIVGDFKIKAGFTGSIISGINFLAQIKYAEPVASLTINRCRVTSFGVTTSIDGSGLTVSESVVGIMDLPRGSHTITNSIIEERISGFFSGGLYVFLRNSIVLDKSNANSFSLVTSLDVSNSIIFLKQGGTSVVLGSGASVSSSNFSNCLFIGEATRVNATITGAGNVRQDQTFRPSVLVLPAAEAFSIGADYHTKAACNCSDRGVYSGTGLFRATPSVQIAEKNISTSTNTNFLKFQIKIKTDN
jgi:hypothetical protein